MVIRHDVNEPKFKGDNPEVGATKKEEGDAAYYRSKRESSRARREYEEEERAIRQGEKLEEDPPQPPFQIKGSINLGDFDIQAERKAEEARATEAQKALAERVDKIQSEAKAEIDLLRKANDDQRDKILDIQRRSFEDSTKAQIDSLAKMLEGRGSANSDMVNQIDQMSKVAQALGFSKGAESTNDPPQIRLAIMKMEIEQNQAARQFEWDKIQSERTWQIEIKKLDIENMGMAAKIKSEQDKSGRIASPLESIGAAIARGLLDGGGQVPTPPQVTRRGKQQQQQPQQEEEAPQARKFKMEAAVGEQGEMECPECQERVAIGPTARKAVCAACESEIIITREPANA